MNECKELAHVLGRLKLNEARMSEAQKKVYATQLANVRKHATRLALKIGRSFLTMGIDLADGDDGARVMDRVRSVLSDNEWRDAEEAALAVLFNTYSLDAYLTALCPLYNKLYFLGYGPYWTEHCKAVTDSDAYAQFSYYNDIIDMFWVEDWHEWKRKCEWTVTVMLPPTMKQINEEYAREMARLEEENAEA